jgi:primary-amine oxidase
MRIERGWAAWGIVLAAMTMGSAASAITCPGGSFAIDETLTTGSRWEMCWEDLAAEGIVFRDVHFTPPGETRRRVLKEASIAQIHLVYDDDSARRLLVSEDGLGGMSRVALLPGDCPSGTLLSDGSTDALCRISAGRGYAWKYEFAEALQQGYWLELTSISRIGDLTWIVRWRFYDDGGIEPAIGSTGELAAFGNDPAFGEPVGSGGAIGVGWVASTYWRLDFDIGSSPGDDLVERFELTPSADGLRKTLSTMVLSTEGGETLDAQLKRSWRVRDSSTTNSDGHAISYHLEPFQAGHHYQPMASESWADADFAVSVYDACERLAAGNPTTGGCAADLASFLDGESTDGADVVLWYRTTYHHYARDEDAPYVGTRWQSYLLLPRDWTHNNPLVLP